MKKSRCRIKTQTTHRSAKHSEEPNVTVYTDLPPDVHGQLRCYLVLTLTSFSFRGEHNSLHTYNLFNAVVKWWGEQSQGTYFNTKKLPGIAKYAIKCGPKQFSSYLNDMNKLTIDIIDPNTFRVVATAAVSVKQLSKNNPLCQTVSIKDPVRSDILGSLNIGLKIMPIPVVFEDRNIPTLDEPSPVISSSKSPESEDISDLKSPVRFKHLPSETKQSKENVFPSSKKKKDAKITKLIAEVLERSRVLKENLVKSQLQLDLNVDDMKNDISKNIDTLPQNVIKEVSKHSINDGNTTNEGDNTVDLYFGKDHIDSVLKKHGLDCSDCSSSTSSLHDESLIAHLFYNKAEVSEVSSDSDEEIEFKSKQMSEPPTKEVHHFNEQEVHHFNEQEVHHFNEQPNCDDNDVSQGLSINKITALGRINKCKVILDRIKFTDGEIKKGTYFLEYQLPIREEEVVKTITSRHTEEEDLNLSHTNLSLSLSHTNIIPIYFDEVLIEQWRMRSVCLKLYYKESVEQKPLLIADGVIALIRVFLSDKFCLKIEHSLHDMDDGNLVGMLEGSLVLADGRLDDVFVSNTPTRDVQKTAVPSLNILISIPLGKALQGEAKSTNSYLVVRLVDSVERLTSEVIWETPHPLYNMKYIIPFTLTSAIVTRYKDNFVIVEVWNRTGVKDKLIGITKLPTNQFYLSLKDGPLSTTPVVAIDGYMPVIDLLTNTRCGMLKVILAVGSSEQLTALTSSQPCPSVQCTEPTPDEAPTPTLSPKVKHTLTLSLLTIDNLVLFEECVWGQTDCFVKFTVPQPTHDGQGTELKTFSTHNITSASFVKIGSKFNISLLLDEGTSLPGFLSKHLSDNCIVFELWRRFYYPNLRDQLAAKCVLTLQEVSHLMTLTPGTCQQYSLQFSLIQGVPTSVGTLNMSVEYNSEIGQQTVPQSVNHIQLVVTVGRGCGLQFAAQIVCSEGVDIDHAATVGVDTYVMIEVSFASLQRETSLRARTFTPSYASHFSFTLPTVLSDIHSGPPTLAENISKGSLNISLFHKSDKLRSKGADIVLAKTTIALESLLTRQSGIHGWQPLYSVSNKACVAGLEVEIGFGDVSDRELVIEDASSRGWVAPQSYPLLDIEYLSVTLSVDLLWVSDQVLQCYKSTKDMCYEERQCYVRVKFYNSDAVCSDPVTLSPTNITHDKRCRGETSFCHSFPYSISTNLLWCLREEPVEIQVWLLPRGGSTDIGDTILGCAYLSLSNCLSSLAFPSTTAQVLPLLKATSPNMGGASVHITGTIDKLSHLPTIPAEDLTIDTFTEDHTTEIIQEPPIVDEPLTVVIEGFKFNVTIDKSTNVTSTLDDQCVYCALQFNDDVIARTDYRELSNTICWNFKCEAILPYKCFIGQDKIVTLYLITQDLEDNDNGRDTKIGSTIVDLTTLLIGFSYIEGWYSIEGFKGEMLGQIKLSLTPLETVSRHLARVGVGDVRDVRESGTEALRTEHVRRDAEPICVSSNTESIRKFSERLLSFGTSVELSRDDHPNIADIGRVLDNVQSMIRNIGAKTIIPTEPVSTPTEPASTEPMSTTSISTQSSVEMSTSTRAVSTENIPDIGKDTGKESSQNLDDQIEGSLNNNHDGDDGTADNGDDGNGDVAEDIEEVEREEGELLLDTFDITVDTDCLSNFDNISNISDTVSEITQLLLDVKEQTALLESFEKLQIDKSQLDEEIPGEEDKIMQGDDEITDIAECSRPKHEKDGSSTSDRTPQDGSSTSDAVYNMPRSCSDAVYNMPRSCSDGHSKDLITSDAPLPNFFMTAKKLSEALVDLKTTGKRPSPKLLDQQPERTNEAPRRPLSSLMRTTPSEDQRARIYRIFNH